MICDYCAKSHISPSIYWLFTDRNDYDTNIYNEKSVSRNWDEFAQWLCKVVLKRIAYQNEVSGYFILCGFKHIWYPHIHHLPNLSCVCVSMYSLFLSQIAIWSESLERKISRVCYIATIFVIMQMKLELTLKKYTLFSLQHIGLKVQILVFLMQPKANNYYMQICQSIISTECFVLTQ